MWRYTTLYFFLFGLSIFHAMLTLSQDIPPIVEFIVRVVRVLVFAFLLIVGHVGIVIDCLIEIVDVFVGKSSFGIFQ